MTATGELTRYDTAIIGSGFGGSILAMMLRRAGQRVLLIEKTRHPRFAIGESTTPLSNLLLEEIAHESGLPNLLPLTEWGRWQAKLPHLPCGLKRGFSFYRHTPGAGLDPKDRAHQLLVAASSHDLVADTHWYRPAVDEFLVAQAIGVGVDYQPETSVVGLAKSNGVWTLDLFSHGQLWKEGANFIVDASGPGGCLTRLLEITAGAPEAMPKTQALFAHFAGVRRLGDCDPGFLESAPPYPVDDAAVHHLIDGGWVWVLRFNNGVTSAGVVLEDAVAEKIGLRHMEAGWQELLALYPGLRASLGSAQRVTDWHYAPRVGSRVDRVAGEGWALLPSAAGFVDPMLSTGFALTLLGVRRLARLLGAAHSAAEWRAGLEEYERITLLELDHTAELIGALYANLANFDTFRDLTLLYFAAASYSETVRRLGRSERADGFLLANDAVLGPAMRQICQRARANPGQAIQAEVHRWIEPIDIAGLREMSGANWYSVQLEDLLSQSAKVGATRGEVLEMLQRCGAL